MKKLRRKKERPRGKSEDKRRDEMVPISEKLNPKQEENLPEIAIMWVMEDLNNLAFILNLLSNTEKETLFAEIRKEMRPNILKARDRQQNNLDKFDP